MPKKSLFKRIFSFSHKLGNSDNQENRPQTIDRPIDQPIESPAEDSAPSTNSILDQTATVQEVPHVSNVQLLKLENLWERACQQIEAKDSKLLEAYKQSLLQNNTNGASSLSSEPCSTLESLINGKLGEIKDARTKVTIGGREIVVRDQVNSTIKRILSVSDFIGTVASNEPHAAIAWAGVLVLLTPITNLVSQDSDAMDGFQTVSNTLVRYRVMETTPIDISPNGNLPGSAGSVEKLGSSIRDLTIALYASILEYQIRLAQHLSASRLYRLAGDMAATDDWALMLQRVTQLDEEIKTQWNTMDGQVIRKVESEVVAIQEKIMLSMDMITEARDESKATRQEQLLNSLEIAKGARFDSYEDQHKSRCLEGTQIDTLQRIQNWLQCTDSETIYWLAGMAGTGKSTISRTVAAACDKRLALTGQVPLRENIFLGGGFFFDKNQGDRKTTRRLFTTLSRCLAEYIPEIKSHVSDYISTHPNIGNESISSQWKNLILNPLLEFEKQNLVPLTLVIVIDALDECDSEDDIDIMLQLFGQAQMLSNISLRFFITSRPEMNIQMSFDNLSDVRICKQELRKVSLQSSSDDTANDIAKFLQSELRGVSKKYSITEDWPSQDDIDQLSIKSDGLFIYAATACRFLGGSRLTATQRNARLKSIFEGKVNKNSPEGNLDTMYSQILEISVLGDSIDEERKQLCDLFQIIVGALVNLSEPLSVKDLAELLSLKHSEVSEFLQRLHSVLSFGEDQDHPIRLVHLSFRDFLLDDQRCQITDFLIDEKKSHGELLQKCLGVLSIALKEDICSLSKPSALAADVDPSQIEDNIPPHAQYASLNWVSHLRDAASEPLDNGDVHKFLKTHLLHWFEALSILRRLSDGVRQVLLLNEYIAGLPEGREGLQALSYDAKQFIFSFRTLFEETPLQIYISALAYCPELSCIREQFGHKISDTIIRAPFVRKHWNPWKQVISKNIDLTSTLAFSPDGKIVASSGAMLWDTTTGNLLNAFNIPVMWVKFSPDGKTFKTMSKDGFLRVWNAATGIMEKEFFTLVSSESKSPTEALLSDDQSLAVIGNNEGYIQIVDLRNWTVVSSMRHDLKMAHILAISRDSSIVATTGRDGGLRLWDTRTGKSRNGFGCICHKRAKTRGGSFSSDDRLFACISHDSTINVWDVKTGNLVKAVGGNWFDLTYLSNDELLMASKNEIRVFNLDQEIITLSIQGQFEAVRFSPDCSLLASWGPAPQLATSMKINIWNTKTGDLVTALEGPFVSVSQVIFTLDNETVATKTQGVVRLWDLKYKAPSESLQEYGEDQMVYRIIPVQGIESIISLPVNPEDYAKLWSARTGSIQHTLGFGISATLSPDGNLIARAGDKGHEIRSVSSGEVLRDLESLDGWKSTSVFSPDSKLLADMELSSTVRNIDSKEANIPKIITKIAHARVWDTSTGEVLHQFENESASDEPFRTVLSAFSQDGDYMAIVLQREIPLRQHASLEIWDIRSWTLMKNVTFSDTTISSIALSSNGRYLAFASTSVGLRLRDLDTNQETIIAEYAANLAIEFSPDGRNFAFVGFISGPEDNVIGVCDVQTATLIGTKGVGPTRGSWLRFSEDGSTIDTAMGRMDVQSFYPEENLRESRSLFVDYDWVICGSEKVFQFPLGTEVLCAAAMKDTLMVSYKVGQVDFLEFKASRHTSWLARRAGI